MKTITFNTTEYEIERDPNVSASRIQVALVDNEVSIDKLREELDGIDTITIKEDNKVVGVYTAYTTLLAICVSSDNISVEMLNTDLQKQIDNMSVELNTIRTTQVEQASSINDILKQITSEEGSDEGSSEKRKMVKKIISTEEPTE